MEVRGVVIEGKKYGRLLGYPTANVSISDGIEGGVYAARVSVRGKTYIAAVFIDAPRRLLEAHLLDFDGDLYGETLTIVLGAKLRESKHFESESLLKEAIAQDVENIRSRKNIV